MDASREGIEYQREIDEALASHMSPEEEEAVLQELEQLQKEQMVSFAGHLGCVALCTPGVQVMTSYLS